MAEISDMQGEQEHILVAIDAGIYNVRKAICNWPCPTCNGWISGQVVDASFFAAAGGSHQETFYMQYNSGGQYGLSGNWSSSATGVATVGSTSGMVAGVRPGTAIISAYSTAQEPIYVPNQIGVGITNTSWNMQ